MTILTKDRDEFLKAIGNAVQSYAEVEASQARLLQCVLDVDSMQAAAIFFTGQTVHSRNELLTELLGRKYNDAYKKYWKSCGKFLLKLSKFRNAIVHWHPLAVIYTGRSGDSTKAPSYAQTAIRNPKPGHAGPPLMLAEFNPFVIDCAYIRAEMDQFSGILAHG